MDNDEYKSNYDDETAVATLKKELLEALAFFVPPPDGQCLGQANLLREISV